MAKQVNTNLRMSQDTKEYFDQLFDGSGASSKGEFITMLLDRYNSPQEPITIEKVVEVERRHEYNEIAVKLSPAQLFALRNTVLSMSDFAQKQNEVIDSLASFNKPFLYFGSLFEPEFQSLWVRNRVITNQMTTEEKESVIKFNMSAFLINMFLTNLIEGRISETLVTAETLKSFIAKQIADSKPKTATVEYQQFK